MPSLVSLGQPDSDPEGISLADLGAFEAAAQRLRQGVKPDGGRTEGVATKVLEHYLPHAAQGLFSLPQRGTEAAGTLFRQGDVYDPGPAVEASLMTMGATPFGAPRGAVGAGPIRAYHGSPHDFERFDLSKIGTGEGAQAYGHGLYFAENPKTAQAYKENVAPQLARGSPEEIANLYLQNSSFPVNREKAIADLEGSFIHARTGQPSSSQIQALELLKRGWEPPKGRMYEVNINAQPEQFLQWDKPLREQAANIRSFPGLADAAKEEAYQRAIASTSKQRADQLWSMVKDPETATGQMAYQEFVRQQNIPHAGRSAAVGEQLKEAGIPGIKYLDQGSRNFSLMKPEPHEFLNGQKGWSVNGPKGDRFFDTKPEAQAFIDSLSKGQTSNYVLFRDDIIDILRKYGIAGAAAPALAEILASQHPEAQAQ